MPLLANKLSEEGLPLALRGQALAAIVNGGDTTAAVLLRQLFEAGSSELLQLCSLGCGALQDQKSITILSQMLSYQSPNVRRAACLALVAIGNSGAIEAVATVLLHGEETTRRNAAEALTNFHGEGFAILKEAVTMNDVLVRRSAVYGLGRIHQSWAEEILKRLQTEDNEWIVRNAAAEVLEKKQHKSQHVPKHLPPPSESPWLIEYAGKQGLGVSPDKPATGLLLNALHGGSEEEKLAALAYLRNLPSDDVFGAIFQVMYGNGLELREAAYHTIKEMAARGIDVPDPERYGVG